MTGPGRLIFSQQLWLNCTEMVKSFSFSPNKSKVQISSQLDSIKLESEYSSEEGEELRGL